MNMFVNDSASTAVVAYIQFIDALIADEFIFMMRCHTCEAS